jgi:hypothetical protein
MQLLPKAPPPICNDKVLDALKAIAAAQANLDKATRKPLGKNYSQAEKDVDLAIAQAALSAAKGNPRLVKTATTRWLPIPPNIPSNNYDVAINNSFDLSPLVAQWLSADGLSLLKDKHDPNWQQLFGTVTKLGQTIVVKRYSIGNAETDQMLADGKSRFDSERPSGLVLREPAFGTLRVCKGNCASDIGGVIDTGSDIVPAQPISLPQFGQLRVFPERSVLFENATLVVTLNPDGSLGSVADHSVNSAATGLAGIGTAADAASAAIVARNTAITAANTAQVAKESNADTINKAHADCLTQKALIEAAGERAAPCQ